MRYSLYFWNEGQPNELAAPLNLLERLAEDRNIPGVARLSLPAIKDSFLRHLPDIAVRDREMEWEGPDSRFQVSFTFDDSDQVTSICVSSDDSLSETSDIFDHIIGVTRELGCTAMQFASR